MAHYEDGDPFPDLDQCAGSRFTSLGTSNRMDCCLPYPAGSHRATSQRERRALLGMSPEIVLGRSLEAAIGWPGFEAFRLMIDDLLAKVRRFACWSPTVRWR